MTPEADAAPPPKVTVLERRANPLLEREEVAFRLDFSGPMVARTAALQALAESLGVAPERVALQRLRVLYGHPAARGWARVYASPEALRAVELDHRVRRLAGKEEPAAASEKTEERAEKPAEKKEGTKEGGEKRAEKGGERSEGGEAKRPGKPPAKDKEAEKK